MVNLGMLFLTVLVEPVKGASLETVLLDTLRLANDLAARGATGDTARDPVTLHVTFNGTPVHVSAGEDLLTLQARWQRERTDACGAAHCCDTESHGVMTLDLARRTYSAAGEGA